MTPISKNELRIMRILWNAQTPIDYKQLVTSYNEQYRNDATPVKAQTLLTYVSRLTKKGYVASNKKGRFNYYYSLISDAEYRNAVLPELTYLLYGDEPKPE